MIDEQWLASQLRARGLVSEDAIKQAQAADGGDLCVNLVTSGAIREDDLLRLLSLHFRTRYISVEKMSKARIPQNVLEMLPVTLCEHHLVVPVRLEDKGKSLSIVTIDPSDTATAAAIRDATSVEQVKSYLALRPAIEAAIGKWYKGDIHAFARAEEGIHRSYSRLLDIYDQRTIDLGGDRQAATKEAIDELSLDGSPIRQQRSARPSRNADAADDSKTPAPQQQDSDTPPPKAQPAMAGTGGDDSMPFPANAPRPGGQSPLTDEDVPLETVQQLLSLADLLVMRLEANHPWRGGHSAKVAELMATLARRLELPQMDRDRLQLAAYLHDLGMPGDEHLTALNLGSEDAGAIASQEISNIEELSSRLSLSEGVSNILGTQYERPDGSGMPGSSSGEGVPLGARLLAVVDSYVDLVTRPNDAGPPLDQGQALAQLKKAADEKILDDNAVDVFLQVTSGDALREQLMGQRKRVLIVDADHEVAEALELKVVAAGFDAHRVGSTAEAARDILAVSVDLILSEVALEPVDGFGFLERIRSDVRTKDIPLLFVSSRAASADVTRGFELGAIDYIVKPYNPDVLLAKVKRVLQDQPLSRATRGVSGSLSEMSLPDIVQILSAGRKSGKLQLRVAAGAGEIYLEKGQVIHASVGNLSGEDAFYALLPVTEGEFALEPTEQLPSRVIQKTTQSLMLEAMRHFDEDSRND